NLQTSQYDCGACDKRCLGGTCAAGVCTCPPNEATCPSWGGGVVCTDLNSSITNCGVCGRWCEGGPCTNGACTCWGNGMTPCPLPPAAVALGPGAGLANLVLQCTDTGSDPHNCGACGFVCATGACANGICVPCAPPLMICPAIGGPLCTDPKTDSANCGVC